MSEIILRSYVEADNSAVVTLILTIQQQEFAIPVTAEDQPDLGAIGEVYQSGTGGFWVAEQAGRIVGTIGLIGFGERQGALRKMFVAADMRGREHGVAARLLATVLDHARAHALTAITLGTLQRLHAAVRFYEKNGFVEIAAEVLPAGFPRMPVDDRFFRLDLR